MTPRSTLLAALLAVAALGTAPPARAAESGVALARFDVDATPPVGAALAYGPVVAPADLQLRCRGIVLTGAGRPIVLCAVDWIGVGNEAHDAFRAALAAAAGTDPERVAVHALHQHDAPHADFTAERLLRALGVQDHPRFAGDFHREVIGRAAAAVTAALPGARRVTHAGFGRGTVHEVASNRRILGPDGTVAAWRASATKDAGLRGLPEGTIDPEVAALAFFAGTEPLAVVTSYATHPMSYYRTGVPSPDFPGIARFIRTQELPGALHLHFTGAAGNVAAGKYNDGAPANRVALALRLAAGMRDAYAAAARAALPLDPADVGWAVEHVTLAARAELDRGALEGQVRAKPDGGTFSPVDALAFATRAADGRAIAVTCLRVGTARMLHLPGELFIEYQLAARAARPELGVFMAAYGDYGPGYIGTAAAYAQGGYETQLKSSFVGPAAEARLLAAIRALVEARP